MSLVGGARHPFAGLTIAAVAGILVAERWPALTLPVLTIAIAGMTAALRWRFTPLLFASVGAAFFCLHSSRVLHTPAETLASLTGNEMRAASLQGTVIDDPKFDPAGNATFLLRLSSIQSGDETLINRATVYVRWRGRPAPADSLALFGTIQPPDPPRNPGEFDMREYLARIGVTRTVKVRYPENGAILRHGNAFSILRAAAQARAWMQRTLSRGLEDSPEVVGLICGTSLGLRHQTPEDIEEPFQQTGTLHLFAVAGLHIGIVAFLLWTAASVLRLPRKIATALIIPLLFFYAAVTGLHTASVRAAVMSALLMSAIFFDRKLLAFNSLAAAAFLILLWDSNQLFTSGFQLSFSVVAAIILFADPLYQRFRRFGQPDPFLPRPLFSRWRKLQVGTSRAGSRRLDFARGLDRLAALRLRLLQSRRADLAHCQSRHRADRLFRARARLAFSAQRSALACALSHFQQRKLGHLPRAARGRPPFRLCPRRAHLPRASRRAARIRLHHRSG